MWEAFDVGGSLGGIVALGLVVLGTVRKQVT